MDNAADDVEPTSWNLVPLTPEYLEAEHGGYVTAIEKALNEEQIHNIALSGNYGVGKSSILREVARRLNKHVVELSLSTLTPLEVSKIDESVPIQASTPTNRIQKEIVKQLLYREDPGKTRASRFRRIERFHWQAQIGTALLMGLVIAVIFLLLGWTARITSVFPALNAAGLWVHSIVWGAASAVSFLVQRLFHGKLHIKELSAGSATVTLDDSSVSYFDQYLDEIVYFFEVSGCDIVIFEDIDRFNDSHIFDTLRALNTLLNASPQIKEPVRFIYAIRDSIFDRIGLEAEGREVEPDEADDPAQSEAIRANRTKFFDLVIPVVPFITHRSARNLATQLLDAIDHQVKPELLDLAAQYVPDMRLLKNVRNEFIVFRDRIFSGDGEHLDLSETDLFAMMLYKSTHLTDFEKIRLGTSTLDGLYKASRTLVTDNIKKIESERRALRQQLGRIDGAAMRSSQLGDRLLAHVQRIAEAAGYQHQSEEFKFNGVEWSTEDLKNAKFWTEFVSSAPGDAVLQWSSTTKSYPFNGLSLSFTRDALSAALGDRLDAASWNEEDRKHMTEQIDEKAAQIRFLRGADLGDLIKRPEFRVTCKDIERIPKDTEQTFEEIAKKLLGRGLAYHLVRAGYINRNFTLYTSTFYGDRVSPAATNFIIHHVERDRMDEYFELDAADVDAVVRERGDKALKEPALYNIAILDHLLDTNIPAADFMINSLASFGERQTHFLQSYLSSGEQSQRFIERFSAVSSRVLQYLVSEADLDDAARLQFVDAALAHCQSAEQRADAAVSDYLATHYAEFTTLTSDRTESAQAERVGEIFAKAGVVVPCLQPLGQEVRSSFVSHNLYEITRENLTLAVDKTESVALDVICAVNETVYTYVLEHVSTYLDATKGTSATVDADVHFIAVIKDVLEHGADRLGDIVDRAAPACRVEDLTEVSDKAWPALAEHRRFPATFGNVTSYVTGRGSIDAQLSNVLTAAGTITDVSGADEGQKVSLAVAILAARDLLPSPVLRVHLVKSLGPKEPLGVGAVDAETGELFALLLKDHLIADDAESYEHLATTDWPTRKAFISSSEKFSSYMTPGLVGPDLTSLIVDSEIDDAVKDVVASQAADYVRVADRHGLKELAKFAVQHRDELPADVVMKLAQGGVPAQHIVPLLEPHLKVIGRDQLFTILSALGGGYEKLTTVGRDKPTIPNTSADHSLLKRLKDEGIVNSWKPEKGKIRVFKKHG